jgi:LCP family protein required for cell wall assembly
MLIVGKDVAGLNTDTMMLCRYDSVDHKLNVCSLPRDTLTNIPAGNKKLNNAYGYSSKTGDIEKLLDSVEDIAGFRPDSYVLIDTDTFVKMIDAMGGVDFDVPVDMNYEDFVQNLYIHINKGYQHLNGTQTMQVFRFRHTYSNGDLGRIDVQHDLIKACASQWLQLGNWNKLLPAAKIVLDNAKTNLSYGNMQWYAKEFFKMSADDISFMTVPNTGCYIRRYSYVSINVDEWMTMVNTYLNPTDTPITKENCNILYQIRPEGNSTSISAANYAVTNGGEVAGGINSFEINKY